MDVTSAINAVERFINDILGRIIPGGVLVVGLQALGARTGAFTIDMDVETTNGLLVWIVCAYLAGHVLDQIRILTVNRFKKNAPARPAKIAETSFEQLVKPHLEALGIEADGARNTESKRSIAMSMSDEARDMSRQFRFLQLLCDGVSTALYLLAFGSVLAFGIQMVRGLESDFGLLAFVPVAVVLGILLQLRGRYWNDKSESVCFDIVIGEYLKARIKIAAEQDAQAES